MRPRVSIPQRQTREDRRLDAIARIYDQRLLKEQLKEPLQFLTKFYQQKIRTGPTPGAIARKWLEWKEQVLLQGHCIRTFHVSEPGKIYIEFDPEAPARTVAKEVGVYLQTMRTLDRLERSNFTVPAQNPGARSRHPINGQDFLQDALIVMAKNARWSYKKTANELRSLKELGWPRQEVTAVNRLKKRIPILRKALGRDLLP